MSAAGALNEFVFHCRDLGGNEMGKRENEKFGTLNFTSAMIMEGLAVSF